MGSNRFCVSPHDIRHLQKEGLGWGHDLDCGCLNLEVPTPAVGRAGRVNRLLQRIIGKGV